MTKRFAFMSRIAVCNARTRAVGYQITPSTNNHLRAHTHTYTYTHTRIHTHTHSPLVLLLLLLLSVRSFLPPELTRSFGKQWDRPALSLTAAVIHSLFPSSPVCSVNTRVMWRGGKARMKQAVADQIRNVIIMQRFALENIAGYIMRGK